MLANLAVVAAILQGGHCQTLVLARTFWRNLAGTDFGPVLRSRYRVADEIGGRGMGHTHAGDRDEARRVTPGQYSG
ncbi:MAG TPA: hypothetical protein VFD43_12035 [Planctomycetota bacterium]|nr:hypothetical protein [Planctomycetota bacterium]